MVNTIFTPKFAKVSHGAFWEQLLYNRVWAVAHNDIIERHNLGVAFRTFEAHMKAAALTGNMQHLPRPIVEVSVGP
jgi:hypothetical protein